MGRACNHFLAINDLDLIVAGDSYIGIAPVVHNGVQEDILIADPIPLGVQHLSNDVRGQFFGTTIWEVDLIDPCI